MIIAITGNDGAGKSTLIRNLKGFIEKNEKKCVIVDKWEILNEETLPECRFIKPNLDLLRQCISDMEGYNRFLFLMWTLYITAEKHIQKEKDTIYLLDGYWMKHAATEVVLGTDEQWILNTVNKFIEPDVTIYLDIDPETSYLRKDDVTEYECGRKKVTKTNFINHQNKLNKLLTQWAITYDWKCISANQSKSRVFKEVVKKVGLI